MPKIVTLFFSDDSNADRFVEFNTRGYFAFVETVSAPKMDTIINYRRYRRAKTTY